MSLLGDWESFMSGQPLPQVAAAEKGKSPLPSSINISTKTLMMKASDGLIELEKLFWALELVRYSDPAEGCTKKEMKFTCSSAEEVRHLEERVAPFSYATTNVIQHVEVAGKFRHVCNVKIGLCKKDIMTNRVSKKESFYNCVAIFVRIECDQGFKEFRVQVFNTGKIEIPGVQNNDHVPLILDVLSSSLTAVFPAFSILPDSLSVVLINSNFDCRFCIQREKLYTILRDVYSFAVIYDPCHYPGIQCKLYYDDAGDIHSVLRDAYHEISVMFFWTGRVLIVGKCDEHIIHKAYAYVHKILSDEFSKIQDPHVHSSVVKKPPKKLRVQITFKKPT